MKLEEIEKLCNEATPGPWMAFIPNDERLVQKAIVSGPKQYINNSFSSEDAEFIAASRTLMPKLLDVAKAAKRHCMIWDGQRDFIYARLKTLGIALDGVTGIDPKFRYDNMLGLQEALDELETE